MKLKKIELKNYAQHKNLDVTFNPEAGVIGIIGPMGSGKSNLIGAIETGVRGEFVRKKSSLITRGEKESHITLTVDISGKEYTITRPLSGSQLASIKSESLEVTGSDSVSSFLLNALEVDSSILKNIVFIRQEEMSNILFCSPTERDRIASKFFGLDNAVIIEKELSLEINNIKFHATQDSLESIDEKIVEVKKQKENSNAELEKEGEVDPKELEDLENKMQSYLKKIKNTNLWDLYLSQKDTLEEDVNRLMATRTEKKNKIAGVDIQSEISNLEKEKKNKSVIEAKAQILGQIAKTQTDLSKLVDRSELKEELVSIKEQIDTISISDLATQQVTDLRHEIINEVNVNKTTSCPICTSVINNTDSITKLIENDQQVTKDISKLADLKAEYNEKKLRYQNWEFSYKSFNKKIEDYEKELSEFPEVIEENVNKYLDSIKSYEETSSEIKRLESEIHFKNNKILELNIPTKPKDDQEEDIKYSPEELQNKIRDCNNKAIRINEIKNNNKILDERIESLIMQYATAKGIERENSIASQLKNSLIRIRNQFHPDGAPGVLIKMRIKRMEEKINDLLSTFNAGFSVRANEGFSFLAIFPNNDEPIEAEELSGGQKTVLSICFRLACIQTFSSSVGLMIIDEPTGWLSVAAVLEFKKIMGKMKTMAKELGFQFIIVTHSLELLDGFDQVIDLT